uniref:Uncharacterized protein n=1 Tax=Arundo donax TaxID=35708 RepID=A0A0A8YAQ2_ARUDO
MLPASTRPSSDKGPFHVILRKSKKPGPSDRGADRWCMWDLYIE